MWNFHHTVQFMCIHSVVSFFSGGFRLPLMTTLSQISMLCLSTSILTFSSLIFFYTMYVLSLNDDVLYRYTVGTSWSEEMSSGGEISVTVEETMQVLIQWWSNDESLTIQWSDNNPMIQLWIIGDPIIRSLPNARIMNQCWSNDQIIIQAGFWSIFSSELGVSASTGYNWQSVSASAQAEETTTTIAMTVIVMIIMIMTRMMRRRKDGDDDDDDVRLCLGWETTSSIGMMVISVRRHLEQ